MNSSAGTTLGAGGEPLPRWLGARLARALGVMLLLSLAIAGLLTALSGHGFGPNLVYSLCIGLSCWVFTDGLRLALIVLRQARRRAAGQPLLLPSTGLDWRILMPLLVLGSAIGLPVGLWIADQVYGGRSPSLLQWDSPTTRITIAVTVLASLFVLFALTTLERLAAARVNAATARAEASALELKLLQSQLEPHMLFNTLATLRVLIGLDPAQAQAMLDRLIAFLRATLSATRVERHALATEFARIDDYLALMSLRMGPRLAPRLDLPAELRQAQVPPLILQPLVENAIRHGLEPQVAGGRLEVAARREAGQLVLTVRDDGAGLAAQPAAGGTHFGLQQVRARLATLFGDAASLTLAPGPGAGALATIRMPLQEAAS